MNPTKQDIVLSLNIKYQIVQEHEDAELEVPELLLEEIGELEQEFIQRLQVA
ncbi:hypothetical protein [Vibrio coralliilyticus]|uniref:hypothetical protein n=1 Tax=Vibrio coralliilyticus TaxID=190893 RepID=UPI0018C8991A|nr:hypothetical protein [Vibrio coralliilyticus]